MIILIYSVYQIMEAGKEADDEMLQDLLMLPEGGKEVCLCIFKYYKHYEY